MKVSEMIKNLQDFINENGDLECWCAKDDEGNGYQKIYYTPSMYYVDSDNEVYGSVEDIEYCDLSMADVTPICIVN